MNKTIEPATIDANDLADVTGGWGPVARLGAAAVRGTGRLLFSQGPLFPGLRRNGGPGIGGGGAAGGCANGQCG